jgi:DNA mismatch endonuclease (patch repair protein)
MTDRISAETRSRLMSRVKNRNTAPELIVRRTLHRMGYRFRLHCKNLPGHPDITLPRYKKVIFVHGCFWHGHDCPRGKRPTTNQAFWDKKIDRNIERDAKAVAALVEAGWNVLVLWDCQVKQPELLTTLLSTFMGEKSSCGK